jgi:hypothetical protein
MHRQVEAMLCIVSEELERMRHEPVVRFYTEHSVTVRKEMSRLVFISSVIETEYPNKYGLICVLSFEIGELIFYPTLSDFRKSYVL